MWVQGFNFDFDPFLDSLSFTRGITGYYNPNSISSLDSMQGFQLLLPFLPFVSFRNGSVGCWIVVCFTHDVSPPILASHMGAQDYCQNTFRMFSE